MTRSENYNLIISKSPVVSRDTLDKYDNVIGIHINDKRVNCSLSKKIKPFKQFNIRNWKNKVDENNACLDINHESLESIEHVDENRYPTTIIYYNDGTDRFICGNEVLAELPNPNDIKLDINDVMFGKCPQLSELNKDPTSVMSDFMGNLHKEAITIFERMLNKETGSFQKTEANTECATNFTLDPTTCRYCVAGPSDNTFRTLIRDAFKQASIISENDPQDRLIFVSNAEALGYYYISTKNFNREGPEFIFFDMNYIHASFSKIQIDLTESTSNVYEFSVENDSIQGSYPLKKHYRNQVQDNDSIDEQIERLHEIIQNLDINSASEFEEPILTPFNRHVFNLMSELFERNERVEKILYSGNIAKFPNFYENIPNNLVNRIEHFDYDTCAISQGAVIHALKVKGVKIPHRNLDNNIQVARNQNDRSTNSLDNSTDLRGYKYIVGLDFGTTFSGCSFVRTDDPAKIYPIDGWPGGDRNPKTRTALLHNIDTGKIEENWGDRVKLHKKKNIVVLEGFKLLLSPKNIKEYYGEGNKYVEGVASKTPKKHEVQDLIAAYLEKLKVHTVNTIKSKEKIGFFRRDPKIKYVLTVPAMWNEAAKSTMLSAAVKAGLADNMDDISIVTEPEAAAICFGDMLSRLSPDNASFIVCDAGGGTVDLVTFKASKDQQNDVDTIQQIGKGRGNTFGSNYINKQFEKYVHKCFPDNYNKKEKFFEHLYDEFETIKCNFNDRGSEIKILIPKFMKMNLKGKKVEGKIENDHFVIPIVDIKKMFDNAVNETLQLLTEQYEETKDKKVSCILMVGGFSQSNYLKKQVDVWCKSRGLTYWHSGNRNLMTTVSYGAASFGSQPRLVTRKYAGQSYAVLLDNYTRQLKYLVKKNQAIEYGAYVFTYQFKVDKDDSLAIAIFSSEKDVKDDEGDIVDYSNDFVKALEVRLNLPKNTTSATIRICLALNINGVLCSVAHVEDNQELGDTLKETNHIKYAVRYPVVGKNMDAVAIMEAENYQPYSTSR